MTLTPDARARAHPVYPDGPACQPNCPGEWSSYHDGYADGYLRAEAAQPAPPLDDLGAAWAEVEAALPEGWHVDGLSWVGAEGYEAHCEPCPGCGGPSATGPTPAAALRGLAVRLSETRCDFCLEGLPLDATGWHIREPGPDDLEGIQRIPCARQP